MLSNIYCVNCLYICCICVFVQSAKGGNYQNAWRDALGPIVGASWPPAATISCRPNHATSCHTMSHHPNPCQKMMNNVVKVVNCRHFAPKTRLDFQRLVSPYTFFMIDMMDTSWYAVHICCLVHWIKYSLGGTIIFENIYILFEIVFDMITCFETNLHT